MQICFLTAKISHNENFLENEIEIPTHGELVTIKFSRNEDWPLT